MVSDEEYDSISKNKEIAKSVCLPPVNDLLLEVQRRLKELDEREARLAEKEKESAVYIYVVLLLLLLKLLKVYQ